MLGTIQSREAETARGSVHDSPTAPEAARERPKIASDWMQAIEKSLTFALDNGILFN
jgi:hypothetical protein